MATYQEILDDLKSSMLAKDELKTSTLRMLKAEIMKMEKSGEDVEIDEEVVMQMVKRLVKQRKDSAEQFRDGGREELAEKEEAEIKILQEYLPEQMSEDLVRAEVKSLAESLGITDKSGMGQLMGAVMSKLKGQADGALVKRIVEEVLS